MAIDSEDRPIWESDGDSHRPHTDLPGESEDEKHRLLARQMDDAQAAAVAAAAAPAAVDFFPLALDRNWHRLMPSCDTAGC